MNMRGAKLRKHEWKLECYIDGDFNMVREDFELIISKYDQIFTLENDFLPQISTNFFASIP
jgi:hypothetical protein